MNRQANNFQLAAILVELIKEYPDQRFSQILQNYGFIKPNRAANPEVRVDWQNEFYEESAVILERVKHRVVDAKV
jgi:hypothetical protein